jgi:hypothetical protein
MAGAVAASNRRGGLGEVETYPFWAASPLSSSYNDGLSALGGRSAEGRRAVADAAYETTYARLIAELSLRDVPTVFI